MAPVTRRSRCWSSSSATPAGVAARNPAFDVTPAALITALITEKGVVHAPDRAKIAALFGDYQAIT